MFRRIKEAIMTAASDAATVFVAVNILISFVAILVFALLSRPGGYEPGFAAFVSAVFYAAAAVLAAVLLRVLGSRVGTLARDREGKPLFGNLTLDLMGRLYLPVFICDMTGRTLWYNRAFAEMVKERESLHGKNIASLCGIKPDDLLADQSPSGSLYEAFGGWYSVKAYKMNAQSKSYCVAVWNDLTELQTIRRRLADEETVAAYIVIDNLDELLQYTQDKYRTASADVEAILKRWADPVGGILKEYERDKFIFLFDKSRLEEFVADRFDVLDKIREVRIGEGSLPVTVSIGISDISGTLYEKERAAHAALDMALQRGGDQVVVKTKSGLDFFGGKTKSMQKRTKVRARVIANELLMHISKSANVLVMGHRNADFDSIGSCAGIARLALFCGVRVNIVANLKDAGLHKCFDKLYSAAGYEDMFLDAASAQDEITSETLLVITDVNNRRQYESSDIYDNVKNTVIIDHHRKTEEFRVQPVISYIETSASSTCELVAEILEEVLPPGMLTKDEADVMFAGILLDTKQFSRNTGVRTFSAALYLRGEGANPPDAQALFKTELSELVREAKFQSNVAVYRGSVAISLSDADDNTDADRIIAAKTADKLLGIDGVLASFVLCRIGNVVNISARSAGTINVQLIVEKLGGGGHYDVAATQIKDGTMSDALGRLKAAIDSYFDENTADG